MNRRSEITQIYEGTNQIQRMVMSIAATRSTNSTGSLAPCTCLHISRVLARKRLPGERVGEEAKRRALVLETTIQGPRDGCQQSD